MMRRRREGSLTEERSGILQRDGNIIRLEVVVSPVMSRFCVATEVSAH